MQILVLLCLRQRLHNPHLHFYRRIPSTNTPKNLLDLHFRFTHGRTLPSGSPPHLPFTSGSHFGIDRCSSTRVDLRLREDEGL
jgi:hypothetical protein